MKFTRHSRSVRASLFLSVAGLGLTAMPALAADGDAPLTTSGPLDPVQAVREAHSSAPAVGRVPGATEVDAQIVIGYPGTPTTARDPVDVNGVGQMIIDNGDGSLGLCTGTLINPRTVIFAAHCVNTRAASDYGAASGGTPIGFGFSNYNIPGIIEWYFDGDGQYKTNTDLAFYNVNAVAYNEISTEPGNGFLYGDVAIASLDAPAQDIPTWAMLFSPLPAAGGGADGTGYHVTITGYGNNGTGATGSNGGIDYRRRVAENMLGALASIDDFESFLFGGASGLPQNLYWIDFDDPRRGTGAADPRDFNAWRDNPTPNEGITASGDSGGPLILDNTFARELVIGVLSGGYTRFFNGAPANGYGTASFYQPLYLYWDWIAANNPYRYVSNIAGNRNWNDGTNWVTNVDPNYFIIGPDGQLVNGVPTTPGEGPNGTEGKFGEACFEGPVAGNFSECYDFATDTYTAGIRPIGTDGTQDSAATAAAATLTGGASDNAATASFIDRIAPTAQAEGEAVAALPAATIANGLPGATGFVPNNSDGDPANGVLPRYFDVTLSAAGTTTLNTAVTIDRFTLAGLNAGLNITSTGSLTSLMDVTQVIGTLHVDGALTTPRDFFIMAGGLSGSGTINAPYTTSMAGVITPGTATSTGTLTFNGNLILASGTTYLVNLNGTTSDRIVVNATEQVDGIANLGGALALSVTSALRANQTYTILTAEGGISGGFAAPESISAILSPTLTYTDTAVQLSIEAGNYTDVVSASNPIAYAYAQLLDANRSQAPRYDGFYGPLDLQDAPTILGALNGLAPAIETTAQTLGIVTTDATSTFIRNRLISLDPANLGGTLARYGQPVQVAALSLSPMGGNAVRSDMAAPMMLQEGALPETMSGFVSGGYLTGDGASMSGIGGRDNYDGWYIGAGIEASIGDNALIGFAGNFTDTDGTASFPGQSARGEAFQGTLYGKLKMGGATLDAQATAGALSTRTTRTVAFLGQPYTLRAEDTALIVGGEIGVGFDLGLDNFEITPRIAGRATYIGFGSALEEGGPMALNYQREAYESYQARAGVTFASRSEKIRPFVTATYVHELNDRPSAVSANLVGGIGNGVAFALNGQDKNWAEVSGGLTLKAGAVDLSVSADTTISREDLSAQTYRGSITFRF